MDLDDLGPRGRSLGCLLGVIALIPLCTAAVGAYGLWVWNGLPAAKRDPKLHEALTGSLHTGLWVGLPLLAMTVWMLIKFRNPRS